MKDQDTTQFRGDRESIRWATWDLKNLDNALQLTRGRKVVVQAGGNLGVFAKALSDEFETVYTFEPSPRLFPDMVANAPEPNIIRFQCALGDQPGVVGLRHETDKLDHAGVTHIDGEGVLPVIRLDSLNLPVCDLLYLDVEGFEFFALRGAEETIARCKPTVVVEINECCERYGITADDIGKLMKRLGYVRRLHIHNDHVFVPDRALNLVCVRVGDKYGPEYVETLFDMLLRNLTTREGKVALWCVTDKPDELPEGVNAIAHDPELPGWWQKVRLFSSDMPWEAGDPVVYFDLDVAITGRLEDFVQTKGIIQDWHWPCYNSSVMSWDHGEHAEIWDHFDRGHIDKPGGLIAADLLPKGQVNGGDQEWITESSAWDTFPKEWFRSYRDAKAWPPSDCKAVIFHGDPKPHEVSEGWVADTWKVGGYTSLPEMRGVNVERDFLLENVRINAARELPWFTGTFPSHNKTMVLVCGGPSLKDHLKDIRDHQRRGARIVSVNNTLGFLMANGIKPDKHVMLDARRENVSFVQGAPQGVTYFLASQCHPDVFEALKDHEVTVWHNASDSHSIDDLIAPHEREDRPYLPIPGGCTVGLRSMFLGFISGFRKLHIYGMDGSYEEGRHHAYEQTLNDGEHLLDVVLNGKHYACSNWMARQSNDFEGHWKWLTSNGMNIHVHGRGLIPDMAKALRAQVREQRAA